MKTVTLENQNMMYENSIRTAWGNSFHDPLNLGQADCWNMRSEKEYEAKCRVGLSAALLKAVFDQTIAKGSDAVKGFEVEEGAKVLYELIWEDKAPLTTDLLERFVSFFRGLGYTIV